MSDIEIFNLLFMVVVCSFMGTILGNDFTNHNKGA
jgi:hypothetical protein